MSKAVNEGVTHTEGKTVAELGGVLDGQRLAEPLGSGTGTAMGSGAESATGTGKRGAGGRAGPRKKVADKRREPAEEKKVVARPVAELGTVAPTTASPPSRSGPPGRGREKSLRVIRERPIAAPPDGEDRVSASMLVMARLLEAPVETAWQFLVDPELRGLWFMAAPDDLRVGGHLGLTMNHDRLSDTTALLPASWQAWLGRSWQERIRAFEPLRLLRFSWERGQAGEVTIRLEPVGDRTRLVLSHTGLRGVDDTINFGGGWRAHLAALARRVCGLGVADFPLLVAEAEHAMRVALAQGGAAPAAASTSASASAPAPAPAPESAAAAAAASAPASASASTPAAAAARASSVASDTVRAQAAAATATGIRPGRNLAIKVPLHRWQETVAFYRDRVGLTVIDRNEVSVGFAFGQMTLWVDRVEHQSQVDVWLELFADDPSAALARMESPCRDELEPLAADTGHWTSDPAGTVLLVRPDPEA